MIRISLHSMASEPPFEDLKAYDEWSEISREMLSIVLSSTDPVDTLQWDLRLPCHVKA